MFKMLSTQWKMGLMLAACALPMVGLVAVRVFDLAVSNVVLIALAVACPVSHVLMMRMGLHGHHAENIPDANREVETSTSQTTELEHA